MILICGIPNSGKTTYSQRFDGVVHYDELRLVTSERYAEINRLVALGGCVVDGVFGDKAKRLDLVKNCPQPERKICVWIDTPLDTCLERERHYRRRPLHMVEEFHKRFEPPSFDEGWDEIRIIRNEQILD